MAQLGEALLGKGDLEAATAATRRAVCMASDSGLVNWFRMALRNLAHIQAVRGAPELAARLAGGSHRDIPAFGLDPGIYGEIERRVTAAIGAGQYRRLHDDGYQMTQAELVDLVVAL